MDRKKPIYTCRDCPFQSNDAEKAYEHKYKRGLQHHAIHTIEVHLPTWIDSIDLPSIFWRMNMKQRRLRLVTNLFGIEQVLGIIKIGTLAEEIEPTIVRVCPGCGTPNSAQNAKAMSVESHMTYIQEYACP